MNFCLSDLVPPLRWSDAATIPLLRDQPELPDAWWRTLPMTRVLAVLGPERLAEILVRIALEHWPAAAVGDVLPALYVLDPEEADEPYTAVALDRTGSWAGLLALTGHELREQPFIQPIPVLNALFAAVLGRIANPVTGRRHEPALADDSGAAAGTALPSPAPQPGEATETAAEATEGTEDAEGAEVMAEAAPRAAPEPAAEPAPEPAPEPAAEAVPGVVTTAQQETAEGAAPGPGASGPADQEPATSGAAAPEPLPSRRPAPEPLPKRPAPEPLPKRPAPGSLPKRPVSKPAPSGAAASEPAASMRGLFEPMTAIASAEEAGSAAPAAAGAGAPPAGPANAGPAEPASAGPADREPVPAGPASAEAADGASSPAEPVSHEAVASEPVPAKPERTPEPRENVLRSAPVPELRAGAVQDGEREPVAAGTGQDREPAKDRAPGKDAKQQRGQAGSLHALLDGAFADLDDKSWAVAQNRVFTDAPATVEALSKLFAVQPEVIDEAEADLRRRLGEWLASDEAAPYREHLAKVGEALGKAAPKARLITVASWHARELRSLDVPAWQFVLATLPGHTLAEDWLVEGDITELRHRTRDVISGAKPPLTMSKALDLVASLGIHPDVSKEWLENVPQLRILGGGQRPPQRVNGAGGTGGGGSDAAAPPGPQNRASGTAGPGTAGEEPERREGPFRPLKDVSLTRRCFRQPDGRWWLRIDVTAEHIQGAECPLPSGFAAYLGLSPGMGRRVQSAVGELGLSWQERPTLESLRTLLEDVGARQGSHLFLTLSDEGVLRARHLPAAAEEVEPIARALRLVGYTAPGGSTEQAGRVIATRVGMTGQVALPDLLARLRERGDRDLLSLLA
ncbi:hypothetical protein AB0395_00850 [Streptosporangium sp. NPDC051023]|uniref:hypothetical protein n=1 Tax=Streptosporangium sp. NPDC051023 TaxID=3155410 RepID=UPI00344C8722